MEISSRTRPYKAQSESFLDEIKALRSAQSPSLISRVGEGDRTPESEGGYVELSIYSLCCFM